MSLPRITTNDTGFINAETGKKWTMIGVNFVRLHQFDPNKPTGVGGDHCLFNTNFYAQDTGIENRLEWLGEQGFNTVRVFISHWGHEGNVGDVDVTKDILSPYHNRSYMDNVADFVTKAAKYGLYTTIILDYLPNNAWFRKVARAQSDDYEFFGHESGLNYNAMHLCKGHIYAKKLHVKEFIHSMVLRLGAENMSNIVSWSIDNEMNFRTNLYPFTMTEGLFEHHGSLFDMSKDADRQALADFGAMLYVGEISGLIKDLQPEALVTTGIYTPRIDPAKDGMRSDTKPGEHRRPACVPSMSLFNRLDYADIHVYPKSDDNWTLAHELYKAGGDDIHVPLVIGEFGAYKSQFLNAADAAGEMKLFLMSAQRHDIAGACYWTADTPQPNSWNLIDPVIDGRGQGFVNYAINPKLRPELWGAE